MGKPTGFLEYPRETHPERPPADRVRDWHEFRLSLPVARLRDQGARCMDCGIPFCHTGRVVDGAASGCPLHNLVPEWNDLVYRGRWRDAWERLVSTDTFPEFTGRICPAPCEGACVLGIHAPPVSIRAIEKEISDRAFAEGWVRPKPPARRTGRRVAVVGSGPAGLAAAEFLNRCGHSVVVFERADRFGGLLMYGIPSMKLDKTVVQRRVDLMSAEGVEFRSGIRVGIDLESQRLRSDFDATILCTGSTVPRDLPVAGRDLAGIHFALDFLVDATRRLLSESDPASGPLSARDRRVLVLGGGDTGTDCIATAIRQGCRSVVNLELLPRPPEIRGDGNPWPAWPRVFRTEYGHEEAEAVFGCDPREFAWRTDAFVGEGDRVRAARVAAVEWVRDGDRSLPKAVDGSSRIVEADLVLLALGFLGPEPGFARHLGIALESRSNMLADDSTYSTSVDGIFAAGDCRRGQSLVVWAIREGRGAARACDRWLASRH